MAKNYKFEEAMKRLEKIVNEMEQDLDLEKSLKLFEEGTKLVRFCLYKLNEAKKKVEVLSKKNDKMTIEPFKAD
jgi:exodeoxyribonuclease VII small subunit